LFGGGASSTNPQGDLWFNGGCPKDRFATSRDGELGQNYLCAGLELFFTHTLAAMRIMARLIQAGRSPSDVMAWTAAEDAKRGPYQPCPCGSGKKFRFCHGDSTPSSPFSRMDAGKPAAQKPRLVPVLAGETRCGKRQ